VRIRKNFKTREEAAGEKASLELNANAEVEREARLALNFGVRVNTPRPFLK